MASMHIQCAQSATALLSSKFNCHARTMHYMHARAQIACQSVCRNHLFHYQYHIDYIDDAAVMLPDLMMDGGTAGTIDDAAGSGAAWHCCWWWYCSKLHLSSSPLSWKLTLTRAHLRYVVWTFATSLLAWHGIWHVAYGMWHVAYGMHLAYGMAWHCMWHGMWHVAYGQHGMWHMAYHEHVPTLTHSGTPHPGPPAASSHAHDPNLHGPRPDSGATAAAGAAGACTLLLLLLVLLPPQQAAE